MFLYPLQRAIIGFVQPDPDEILWLFDVRNGLSKIKIDEFLSVAINSGGNDAHLTSIRSMM